MTKKSKFSQSPRANWIALVLMIAFPIFLWLVPAGQFDDTGVVLCPSRFLFDVECFGCGITRAVLHFHHFNFDEAFYHNAFIAIVYPGLVFIWFLWMKHILTNLGFLK